jgi:hypothetical protein
MRHRPVHCIVKSAALFAVMSVLVASCSAGAPAKYYVRELKIDAGQHLIPVGPKSLNAPAADSYYVFFHTGTELSTIVIHFAKQTGSAEVRDLLYLEAVRDRLDRTVKTDQIVTGPFGAVVAEKTCFYNRPVEYSPCSMNVLIQSAHPEIGREIPDAIPEVPKNVPPLTSISIVRFIASGPQLIFGSGNYGVNGAIGNMQSGKVVNGDLQSGSSIIFPLATDFDKIRQTSGLPPRVEVENYLRSKRMPLLNMSNPQGRTIVILVYGFGKLMRQDSLEDGDVTSSRYMRPVVTQEEGILGSLGSLGTDEIIPKMYVTASRI